MANKSAEKPYYVFILYHRAPNGIQSDGERNLIGLRTESDWTANGIRSGGERNPIGRRTENDDLSLEVIRFVVKRRMTCHRLYLANRCICKLYIAYL